MTTANANTNSITWYGSQQESLDLVNAVARNCSCEFGAMGVRITVCAPHRMLVEEQRSLDGLLFARRMADRLRREEWTRVKGAQRTTPGQEELPRLANRGAVDLRA